MGLEALSRGARKVVFIEKNPKVFRLLKTNLSGFDADSQVFLNDAIKALDKLSGEKFDIIFVDPPYASDLIPEVLRKVKEHRLLADDGMLILEYGSEYDFNNVINETGFEIVKEKNYGDTSISFIMLS